MRTLIAGLLMLVAAPAFAQCINCSPGTTPGTGYRATLSNGLVVVMTLDKDNPCHWKAINGGAVYSFFHAGLGAKLPGDGGGIFAKPQVIFRQGGGLSDPHYAKADVAQPRDGSGPWVMAMLDPKGAATGVTVTITPIP